MSKLIYMPKGKAREYSPWACNLYNGCSNRCSYCYNRKGVSCNLLGKDDVSLKNGFSNEEECFETFKAELEKYKSKILSDGKGLFFNFVSDPFLEKTWELNYKCAEYAMSEGVPCVFLSKCMFKQTFLNLFIKNRDLIKVGFTLTGQDKMEPGAFSNSARVDCIKILSNCNVKSWASIEPVVDISSSYNCMKSAYDAGCREFKIGLLSGTRDYSQEDVREFKNRVDNEFSDCEILWKESVLSFIDKGSQGDAK